MSLAHTALKWWAATLVLYFLPAGNHTFLGTLCLSCLICEPKKLSAQKCRGGKCCGEDVVIPVVGFRKQMCSCFKIVNVEFLLTYELDIFSACFMISFNRYFLRAFYLSGPVLSTLDTVVPRFWVEADYNK